jgi:hypothetical protein
MLALTFVAPLLAFKESYLFTLLAGATHLAYVALWLRTADTWPLRSAVKHLALASLALVVAGMPEDWGRAILPAFSRPRGILLACSFFVLLHAMRSRRPDVGLAGALALTVALTLETRMFSGAFHAIAQVSLVFLLLHSLRWSDTEHSGTPGLRWLAALLWVTDACVWTRELRWDGILFVGLAAFVVLAFWLVAWWLRGERGSLVLPAAAMIVLCSGPGNWLVRHGSDGLIALLGSLVLFAAGIVVAWTRHRWESKGKVERG